MSPFDVTLSSPDNHSTDLSLPCSDRSLLSEEPLFATASLGRRWLLLELCGPWGPSAFLDSPSVVDPPLGRRIVRRVEAEGMRIVAIRRPGRRDAPRRWRWFVAESSATTDSTLVGGEVDGPQAYLDLALDGSGGEPLEDPMYAVCAHGRHDRCCAVRGRRAAADLAQQYPESTWECSHLGGDRFAATMIVLPDGLCYGRVDSADALEIAHRHGRGRVDERFLRGRTCFPHVVQAAQHFARNATGDDRLDAFTPVDMVETDAGRTRITLAANRSQCVVTVGETMSPPLLSTCDSTVPGPVRRFTLESIDVSAGPV